ncbi:uncharacterized protein A4U43_C06F5790 [Asparagus officinalis]|uniref:Uncharacterized protein n=1 Tax=Asparagus officinalis TaxID=4686 RepID=A0A5P1EJX6_ASPOF|nr:uncharacterized protein A4U43_C06F5790 [Asparagus officinalis]
MKRGPRPRAQAQGSKPRARPRAPVPPSPSGLPTRCQSTARELVSLTLSRRIKLLPRPPAVDQRRRRALPGAFAPESQARQDSYPLQRLDRHLRCAYACASLRAVRASQHPKTGTKLQHGHAHSRGHARAHIDWPPNPTAPSSLRVSSHDAPSSNSGWAGCLCRGPRHFAPDAVANRFACGPKTPPSPEDLWGSCAGMPQWFAGSKLPAAKLKHHQARTPKQGPEPARSRADLSARSVALAADETCRDERADQLVHLPKPRLTKLQ